MPKWLPFTRIMQLGDTRCDMLPAWEKKYNTKIAMARGTPYETTMVAVDLSEYANKID